MQEQIWKDEAQDQLDKFYKEREQKLAANKVFEHISLFWFDVFLGEKSRRPKCVEIRTGKLRPNWRNDWPREVGEGHGQNRL